MKDSYMEEKLIKISLYVTIVFALVSFVLGIFFRSQVIVFDGLYSLIGVGITTFSLYAVKFMGKHDWRRFPFGKDIIEPLVVIVNYCIILLLVAASLITAIIALFRGGREIMLGPSLVYTAIGTLICVIMYLYLNKKSARLNSEFVSVEANQWYMDTLVSGGILIGFIIAVILQRIPALQALVSYVDPVMVIVVSLYFMKVPVIEIKTALREVLAMPPNGKIRQQVEEVIKYIIDKYNIIDYLIRVAKVGKTLKIEVDFVVDENSAAQSVYEQDQIRQEVNDRISDIEYDKWITLSFTSDRKWII